MLLFGNSFTNVHYGVKHLSLAGKKNTNGFSQPFRSTDINLKGPFVLSLVYPEPVEGKHEHIFHFAFPSSHRAGSG